MAVAAGTILFSTHDVYLDHDTGRHHPERSGRIGAVLAGIDRSGVADALTAVTPRPASRDELTAVHRPELVDAVDAFCRQGGGHIEEDTVASSRSWDAALMAAGAGPDAAERLKRGEADSAFVAVRPPGHHATSGRSMGFCLFNNVAVTAAALAGAGERVLIVDYDAHHGNGTQDIFYEDPRVAYVSLHEWPLYPGTGWLDQTGRGPGAGTTVNVPLPRGATGDVYLAALDRVVAPLAERFAPSWLLLSAGFDGHGRDPLTGLSLSSGDFALVATRLRALIPPGRLIVMLEGGYDLEALTDSTAATLAALAGERLTPEAPTVGGGGHDRVDAAERIQTTPQH